VDLPCPACNARIGYARGTCRTCNRFAAKVRRAVERALAAAHPSEQQSARRTAELELYPRVCAEYVGEDPDHRRTVMAELAAASAR